MGERRTLVWLRPKEMLDSIRQAAWLRSWEADDLPWRGPFARDKTLSILDAGFNVMNTAPHKAAQAMLPGMLQTIAEAICDRPEDTLSQRAARFGAVTATVQRLEPRDALEVMLAGMAVTHAYLIEDAARDVCRSQDDRLKARTRSAIVALGRGMSGFLKELRDVQAGWRKDVAAKPEPDAVALVDVSPAPDRPVDDATATVAKPVAGSTPPGTPVGATPQVPPEGRLPPLRRAETSVAAAMAVLSPPMPPRVASAAGTKPVAAPRVAVHAEQLRTTPPKVSALEAASNAHPVAESRPTAEAAQAA
jgi:hypothetical protein